MFAPNARFVFLLALLFGWGLVRAGTATLARRIVVPEFKVEEGTPSEVFQRIRELARAHDPARQGLNVVFRLTPGGQAILREPGLTMELRDIPLDKLVEYICMASGLHYRFAEEALIVADRPLPEGAMRTRVFKVAPGVVDTPRSRPRPEGIGQRD